MCRNLAQRAKTGDLPILGGRHTECACYLLNGIGASRREQGRGRSLMEASWQRSRWVSGVDKTRTARRPAIAYRRTPPRTGGVLGEEISPTGTFTRLDTVHLGFTVRAGANGFDVFFWRRCEVSLGRRHFRDSEWHLEF